MTASGGFAGKKAGKKGLTEGEWRERLSEQAYRILRKGGTERAFTGPWLDEKREGVFTCAGCGEELFDSASKYESGTGWPSFTRAKEGSVEERADRSFFLRRTETLCGGCGGHLGHVFPDGPAPTGQRYCMNGHALGFRAKGSEGVEEGSD